MQADVLAMRVQIFTKTACLCFKGSELGMVVEDRQEKLCFALSKTIVDGASSLS
jgi:hypothetical protein